MFTVYSTSSHPIYDPEVRSTAPKHTSFYHESYLKTLIEAQLTRERYLEEQRALAAWRAQQETLRQREYHRRQLLGALQSELHRRRPTHYYVLNPVDYIPVEAPASSLSRQERNILTSLLGYDVNYETDYEASRRHRAEQARSEYLRRLEQERNEKEERARIGRAKQLANIERIQKVLNETSVNYKGYNSKATSVGETTVKARSVDDSDRIRKAAIHNARVRLIERLQAFASEFGPEVTNPSTTTQEAAEPVPFETPEIATSPFSTASSPANLSDGPKQNTEGAKLRRRREIAARTIQRRWRSHFAEVAAAKDALHTIDTLRSRFQFLQSSFIPPEQLQFREDSGKPTLLFSSANSMLNTYTHELDKLLSLADGVPSAGNEEVRGARKAFVKSVEEALEEVDTLIRDIWNRQKLVSSEIVSIPISDSENTPIESTVNATSPLDNVNTSIDTLSLITAPAKTIDSKVGDASSMHSSSTLDQDTATITISRSQVNFANVSEGDSATGSPVLVDISPSLNTPISNSEAIHLAEENEVAISASDVQIRQCLNPSDALDFHTNSITIMAEVNSTEHDVPLSIGEDNDVSTHNTELDYTTEAQPIDIPVTPVFNNPDPDEEVVAGNAKIEHKEDADVDVSNTIKGSSAFLSACDLDLAAINNQYPQTNVHADTSLALNDSFDTLSERRQPSEASNPMANAGEDRGMLQESIFFDNERKATPEATGTLSQVLEPDSKSALDVVQSTRAESSSALLPYVVDNVDTYENEDPTSSNPPFISPTSNTDDNFDIVYPDSPSTQSIDDFMGAQQEIGKTPLRVEGLEAKGGTDSDEFELL